MKSLISGQRQIFKSFEHYIDSVYLKWEKNVSSEVPMDARGFCYLFY